MDHPEGRPVSNLAAGAQKGQTRMSAYERWEAAKARPDPKPLDQLSREQLAGRVHVLREAVHGLWTQRDLDGGEHYLCYGAMKKELLQLEGALFRLDHPQQPVASAPVPLPVALAAVAQRAGRSAS